MAFDFINSVVTGTVNGNFIGSGSLSGSLSGSIYATGVQTNGTPFNMAGETQVAKNLSGLTGTISGSAGTIFSSSLGSSIKLYVVNGLIVSASA